MNIYDLIGRIEVNKMRAKKNFNEMGEKFMGKKKYRKLRKHSGIK